MAPDVLQHASLPFPRSLPEFQRLFPDDTACADYLEKIRWEHGFTCPHCKHAGEPFRFKNRPKVLRCRKCRSDIALTAGTVMADTKTPLSVWFWAAYLVASHTAGMSATQFQRQLGLSRYATAHEMLQRLSMMPVTGVGKWGILKNILTGDIPAMRPGPKPKSIAKRFARFVNINGPVPTHRPELGPCHIWTGAKRDGYGTINIAGKAELAHRVAFKLAEGRWPNPCALHHCDTRACVRRTHLFEGTKAENTADMVDKRRGTPRILTDKQVAAVVKRKALGESQASIARSLGVSESLISLTIRCRK